MSLSINQVVDVQLVEQTMGAARRDFSICLLLTPEKGSAFNNVSERYFYVSNADQVGDAFGYGSDTHLAAQAFFSRKPQLRQLMIGRWNKTAQNIEKSDNQLRGAPILTDLNFFKEVTSGYFSFKLGDEVVTVEGIDFSSVSSLGDVANAITVKLPEEATVTLTVDEVGKRIILSDAENTVGYAFNAEITGVYASGNTYPNGRLTPSNPTGEYVGRMLSLEDGQATKVKGNEAATVKAESLMAALAEINNLNSAFYGVYVAGQPTDAEIDSAHSWVNSATPSKILAYTALRDEQIEWSESNIIKKWHDVNSGRVLVQYNRTGDNHAAAALLAEAVSTNWRGSNTAKTLKFKSQSVRSDSKITINEANRCNRLGVNFYTDYDGVPMLAEGVMVGGRFVDEVVGLDAFIDGIQKAAFNYIKSAPKVPQTDKGTAAIISQLIPIAKEFVRNGFLAGGQWNGAPVGELETGDYLEDGYYFYAESFTEQAQTDREQRLGMPISVAIKLAGAIHKQDIIVTFNR